MSLKIGITGQSGFIGTHLYNTLKIFPEKYKCISFQRNFFDNHNRLEQFVSQCNVIVHLAALNRHNDPAVIYETNLNLVNRLIQAMENTQSKPHVLFASSIQENQENSYGQSKKEGRLLLEKWARQNQAQVTGLIIPNVFGPFGHPYYNSVVATFCHQLTHGEQPQIHVDGEIKLIYVAELIQVMIDQILGTGESPSPIVHPVVAHTSTIMVSELLEKLLSFKQSYLEKQIIPGIHNTFDRNLFNTFVCYIDHASFFPGKLEA